MEQDPNINIVLPLRRDELDKAISGAVQAQIATRMSEVIEQLRTEVLGKQRAINKDLESVFAASVSDKESIDRIRDAALQKQADVTKELETLFSSVATAKRGVEDQLDKLTTQIKTKANWYLIPTATVILLAGILGLWAIVGATAVNLKNTVKDTLEQNTTLQGQIATAMSELSKVQSSLIQAQQMAIANQATIDQIKTTNPFADVTQKVGKLTSDYAGLSKRVSIAEDWIKKHKGS
jgi:hypothetical protein